MKAFPNMTNNQGMDLRDYFAVRMMQHLLLVDAVLDVQALAEEAYAIADIMLEARETTKHEHQTQGAPAGGSTADPSSW